LCDGTSIAIGNGKKILNPLSYINAS